MSYWEGIDYRVHKKADGLMVILQDGRCDFMGWLEGIRWRITRKLPDRFIGWMAEDRPTPIAPAH